MFLLTEPNAEVGALHPKAMPVILVTAEEVDLWMTAPAPAALELQRPWPDGRCGSSDRAKEDGPVTAHN